MKTGYGIQRGWLSQECKNAASVRGTLQAARGSGLGAVLELFVPRHLDGFELAFVRRFGIASEIGQFGHVAMQVREAHRERVDFRMCFGKQNAEVFSVVPG